MNPYHGLWLKAQELMPGGVNSPVRAFKSVGLDPLIVSKAKGSKIYDVRGKAYLDLVMSWGPLILGHAHPEILKAVKEALEEGSSFGALSHREILLAEAICNALPSLEKIRFVSSGTEAAMTAIRLARAFTGRDKMIKFEGCYHGHSDFLLAKAGSGLATYSLAGSAGIPKEVLKSTLVLPFNDWVALEKTMNRFGREIACILVEPIPANMGLVFPEKDMLKTLRKMCTQKGILLIFDEVITGFRVGYGGAQELYHVQPDLTILGKIIGGGFPVGAVGGRKEIMDQLAPLGPVYQAGTLSGNPVAMAAGLKTLEILKRKGAYEKLEKLGATLAGGLEEILKKKKISFQLHRIGSMMTLFFNDRPIENYQDVLQCNTEKFNQFFREMFRKRIFLPPSAFETWFLSLSHSAQDIESFLKAADQTFKAY
ncbi:MAG: glutamate-1-semialdehyde 2,1-aminomutase [Chlamydiae bacterium]|nr:glutamate-1-semialdehyde 2,1-aminomutase [Chlamydiota bacterium]MBI3265519.1 glutamate-1-semialdehyde 2,1-aminomutase [Chlamydiota bacterium]